jgi:hypothetical protein
MDTAIPFAAGMLLTLIALALEDWTRQSKQREPGLPPEEELGAAKMFFSAGQRKPTASGQEPPGTSRLERLSGTRRVA